MGSLSEWRAGTGESEEGIVVKEKMYMKISPHTMKGTSSHPPGLWLKQPWLLSTKVEDVRKKKDTRWERTRRI